MLNLLIGCGDRETLPEGEHRFPFCFQLPGNLSSSFEGEHGYIRYKLKMKIKKSWKKDLKLKRMFVVNEIIDVNQQRFRAGPGDNDEKTLGKLKEILLDFKIIFKCDNLFLKYFYLKLD